MAERSKALDSSGNLQCSSLLHSSVETRASSNLALVNIFLFGPVIVYPIMRYRDDQTFLVLPTSQ